MKRFYCTICRRVKRVRQYPSNISHVACEVPEDRTGTCARHVMEPVMQKYAKAHDILPVELNMLRRGKKRA